MADLEDDDAVAEARRLGEISGHEFDARLRARERAERADLWPHHPDLDLRGIPLSGAHLLLEDVARVRQELDELRRFRQVVTDSKGWKAVQMLRRLLGRGWVGYD